MKSRNAGIRSTKGHSGGVRSALRPMGQAAVGLAAALAANGAMAQEAKPPPTDGEKYTLPTVQVTDEAADGYRAPESKKIQKAIVDTPQTVTVVPAQVIEEQQATSVRDALRNVSGITISAGEGGRQGDTFIIRGFSAQTDVFRDGARDLGWYTRDTFNLDGVEVFFGPSAVLFGRGSTGGAINLITKKPRKNAFREVRLTGGTAPWGRVEVDINQPLTNDVQVRLAGAGQLAAVAERDGAQQNRAGISPSVRVALGEKTTLDVDYLYQREFSVPDYGQPYFNGAPVAVTLGVPRSAFYGVERGVAGADTENVNANVATARIEHRFGNGLSLSDSLRFGSINRFARPTAPRGLTPAAEPTTIGRQRFETTTNYLSLINQTDLRAEFSTGPLAHTANVGLELSRETRNQTRDNLNAVGLPTGTNLPADLQDPDPSPDLSPVQHVFSGSNVSQQLAAALYAGDQIAITKFFEIAGSIRADIFDTKYSATAANGTVTDLKSSDAFVNGRVGLIVHPVDKTTVYASYGTSSNPTAEAGTLANGTESLAPESNRTFEAGAKADLFEDRFGASAAVFRIEKTNARVPNTDPDGPPQILAGRQQVQGVNVGIQGAIFEKWRILANYTYMASAITEHTNAYLVGQPLPNTPPHSLSLWTTANIVAGLTIGGGAIYQSSATVNNPASDAVAYLRLPSFWRFDAFAAYQWKMLELQLNVNNLSDVLYYEQSQGGHAVPGAGRSANLSAKVRF